MRRITTTALAAAAAALLALPLTACDTGNQVTGADKSTAADSKSAETTAPAEDTAADDAATEEDAGDQAYGLDDVISYENNVSVSLSGFTRTVSSAYASPENTPYVRFTIKVDNKSGKTLDVTGLSVSCQRMDAGEESDSIFDEGLDGSPSTRLLGGRTISVRWGCALPKDEKNIQIEVSPDFESEAGIFTGSVK